MKRLRGEKERKGQREGKMWKKDGCAYSLSGPNNCELHQVATSEDV